MSRWPQRPLRFYIRDLVTKVDGKVPFHSFIYIVIPRQTRLVASSLFFFFCLGGLYWTDYLESKYPATEAQKKQIEDIKKLRFPTRGDFEEAREQALRAQAMKEADPKWK
jgi:hypothetical protein